MISLRVLKFIFGLTIVYGVFFPKVSYAVIPPDFIFNIGIQIVQFFSLILLFFGTIFGAFFQFFRIRFYSVKRKKTVLTLIIFFIISISLASSYFYATYKQNVEYQEWLKESQKFGVNRYPNGQKDESGRNDENDRTDENSEDIDISLNTFVSKIDISDSSAKFISEYYENISYGRYKNAYEMSKKSVDYDTFEGWYLHTTKIALDGLVRIDEQKSSLELTLFEGNIFTKYGVLMTLSFQDSIPVKVEKSEVKILAQGSIEDNTVSLDKDNLVKEYIFFNNNENKNIVVSNEEFKNIIDSGKNNYIVLDARENIEYENGNFPASVHIRFADLKAGRWIELPKDTFVYVICWSGIRGKEVAEFLRTKKIIASYLENGANGWVEFGGKWMGSIRFGAKYTESRYQAVFNTDEVKNKVNEGIVLVDTREPYEFQKWHIDGSFNIPIMYTPTIHMENVFDQVPPASKIITVCDGYVNCFDSKITGVELERRGHQFLGRYNKPWEYEK